MNPADAMQGLQEAPQVVAPDLLTDTHEQCCEKALRREGVRESPNPIAAYNPGVLRLPWCYIVIFINEGTMGVASIITQIRLRWHTNPQLVEAIVRVIIGLQQVVAITVTPAKNPDGSDGPIHAPMVLWRAVSPLVQELTSKYLYMDQKEAEHLTFATARTMAIQGADYTGTAAQRRATQFALQDARRGGHHGRGGGGGGDGGYQGRGGGNNNGPSYRQTTLPFQPYRGGGGGRGGKRW